MRYQYPNGKIVTKEELREHFNACHPMHCHDDIEFEINLYVGIQNGTLKEVYDEQR